LMASHMVVFLSLAGEQHTQFTDYECIAWENHSIFIIGITIQYMKIVSSYNLTTKYDILTNPRYIPSNVLPSYVHSWYPSIVVLVNLLGLQKTNSNFRMDVEKT
jgi:hypothetical protein